MSTEKMWDYILALRLGQLHGPVLYALATDDAHHYHGTAMARPGRGWVYVRATKLSPDEITRALAAGNFYASTGVVLDDVSSDQRSLTVKIHAEKGVRYTTRFIGTRKDSETFGEVFKLVDGAAAAYEFTGNELYVRATVTSDQPHPDGFSAADLQTAWVQPTVLR
jgi:hypothetical protein